MTLIASDAAPAALLPALAAILHRLVPASVTQEQAAAVLDSGDDAAKAAHNAVASLLLLFGRLRPRDLQLMLVGVSDSTQVLTDLSEQAAAAYAAHKANRIAADSALSAVMDQRAQFVPMAFQVLGQARAAVALHESAALAVDRAKEKLIDTLVESGLPRANVMSFVADRFGDEAERHRADAAKARQRAEAVAAYIDDPFRRLECVGGELAAELQTPMPPITSKGAMDAPPLNAHEMVEAGILARFGGMRRVGAR